jgi:hypothetical protein
MLAGIEWKFGCCVMKRVLRYSVHDIRLPPVMLPGDLDCRVAQGVTSRQDSG